MKIRIKDHKTQKETVVGTGFLPLLSLLFIALKLLGIIGWSWWWILSPLWLPIVIIFLGVILLVFLSEIEKAFRICLRAIRRKPRES
jgi:hypothetical protein